MKTVVNVFVIPVILVLFTACNKDEPTEEEPPDRIVKPLYVTDPVKYDTDDPAIWINRANPAQSLVIGTDKHAKGGLYVFDLKGKIIKEKTVIGLQRPNNVDVAYDVLLDGELVDIAVTSERLTHNLRIFSLPDMTAIDGGGIPAFEGEEGDGYRDLMGIALYTDKDKNTYAIVGRKNGPTDGTYLWQYLLADNGKGQIGGTLIRKFGKFSDNLEIEAIAVDNDLGYVYYSDEQIGVRKYYADPEKGNDELALFATEEFTADQEGISIYKTSKTTGYILVSDQAASQFKVYPREGASGNPNNHPLITSIKTQVIQSDGSDVVSIPLNEDFKHGLLVAMSDDKTFQYYRWEDLAGKKLKVNNR